MNKCVFLTNGNWTATIAPEFAMNAIALTHNGNPVLRSPEDPQDLAKTPVVYGTPMLFPPDKLKDNSFTFEGKQISLTYLYPPEKQGRSMHGIMSTAPFNVISQSDNTVVGEYINQGERYPFPFRMEITCSLTPDGLKQRFSIENIGENAMPLAFGLHTTFVAPETFSVSLGKKWLVDEERYPVELADLNAEELRFVSGRSPQGERIHGGFADNGQHTAIIGDYKYTLSDNLGYWVLWNKSGTEGFISLEPQTGPINALNMPGYYPVVSPGDAIVFETLISLA